MIFRNVWGFFVRTVLVLSVCGAVVPTAQAFDKPTSLSVIVASDFSPYSFTGPNGEPIGYIKDLWDLWARRNGVAVTYRPMDWRAGREAVATGTADVVGSMQNVGADGRLTLSAQSIALIPFHAFYNADVSEIIDAGSLKNVTVGAVEEGGCYDWLQRSGIPHIRTYPSITALVDSIRLGELAVFCSGRANALDGLNRRSLNFKISRELFRGGIHWATRSSAPDLHDFIARGFEAITDEERWEIEKRWEAKPLPSEIETQVLRDLTYSLAAAVTVVLGVVAWNVVLRRRVAAKTAELRATEMRFAAILNNLPECAWVRDPAGRFLAVNASLARLCGETDSNAMTGRTLSEYFPAAMVERYQRHDELMRARMTAMVTVDPVIDASGTKAWTETTQAPFFDENGAYAGSVGISRDITARKQAEDALSEALEAVRASESRHRDLLATLPVGVFESDRNGNVIFANDLGLTLMGGAPQPYAGAWVNLVHPDDRASAAAAIHRLSAEGEPLNLECRSAGGGLPPTWVQVCGIRRCDTGGVIISVTDISEQRQANERLRAREEEFRALSELSPDTIARYDIDCHRLYVNPALATALGGSKDALLGRPPSQAALPGQFQAYEDKIREVAATGCDDVFELLWMVADGNLRTSEIRLMPERDKDGTVLSVIAVGRDVTRLKTVEAELRANAARLSNLIENIPGTCFSIRYLPNGQKRFLYESGADWALFGVPPEEIPTYYHPDDHKLLFEEVPERLRRSGHSEHTFRRLSGGTVAWRHARERVRVWEGGDMIVDGVSFDITEEMEAKQKLEQTAEDLRTTARQLATLLDNLPGMVYRKEYGPAGNSIVYFSGGYKNLTGCDAIPLTYEERLRTVWHPDDHEKLAEYMVSIRAGADRAELKVRFFHSDGSVRWVLLREQVHERRGDWIAAEGLLIDITEEMDAKQSLEANADELRMVTRNLETLLNNLPGTVFRMEYLPDGRKRMLEVFGDAVSGADPGNPKELMEAVHPDDIDLMYRQFAARLRAHGTAEETFRLILPDGGIRWVRTREKVCERIGDRMIIEGQIFDVTVQTIMEQDLRESEQRRQRAESRLRQGRRFEALGQFAGGVAHDFNNLLGAILGYSHFIREDSPPDSALHRHASRIIAAGNKGRAIVEQILNYSRRVELTPNRFTIGALITEVVQLCEIGSLPNVTLSTDYSLGDLEIEADQVQLTRLLMNLCSNARDAMEGKPGTILIGAHQAEFDTGVLQRLMERDEGGDGSDVETWTDAAGQCWLVAGRLPKVLPLVSLYVADTGVGMDAKLLETAFTPFFTTKDRSRGTGLGLAVVYGIVLAHGGALVGRSRPGQGTRFDILLPCRRSPTEPVSLFVPVDAPSQVRVMLVDDNVDVCDAMAEALTRLDYLVDAFSDPAIALEAFQTTPNAWDLLITDQIMPGLRGSDLIREMRTISPDLPCLLCSGYTEELNAAASKKIGANELLRKPFEITELLGAIESALSSRRKPPTKASAA